MMIRKTPLLIILSNYKTQEEARAFFNTIEQLAEENGIVGGVSEQFSDINNLKKYYEQAAKAASISSPSLSIQSIRRYSNLKYYVLLNDLPRSADLQAYISEDYLKLKMHDVEKGTEYCKTLIALILNNNNRKEVCLQLHIHRNTLPQRIQKIEQLLGRLITDTDFMFDMYFSHIIDSFLD